MEAKILGQLEKLENTMIANNALLQQQTSALQIHAQASNKIASSFETIVRDFLSKQNGQLPPDTMPIDSHKEIMKVTLDGQTKSQNRLLMLCAAIVFAALGSIGYVGQRSGDKAADTAIATAKTAGETAVQATKALETAIKETTKSESKSP